MTVSAFPYTGGKSELAPWIVGLLPDHDCYVEPFAGSASVLLEKPRSKVEVINDLDRDVVQFFEVCRDRPDELAEFVHNIPYSRHLYHEWADTFYSGDHPNDPVERAGRWVFLRYSSFGGKYGRKSGFKRASHLNAQPPSKTWAKVPDRVSWLRDRLRGVEIECLDVFEVIDRYDSVHTAFYCDPPYYEAASDYYRESDIDHAQLEAALSNVDGFAIVSYADLPPEYADGWRVRDRDYTQRARRGSTGEWNEDAVERLCLNYDPATADGFAPVEQTTLSMDRKL